MKHVLITHTTQAAAYSDGEVIGAPFAIPAPYENTGIIESVSLIKRSGAAVKLDLLLFTQLPTTTFTDNGALSLNTADESILFDIITFPSADWVLLNATEKAINVKSFLEKVYYSTVEADNYKTLYGVLVARGSVTFATTTPLLARFTFVRGLVT